MRQHAAHVCNQACAIDVDNTKGWVSRAVVRRAYAHQCVLRSGASEGWLRSKVVEGELGRAHGRRCQWKWPGRRGANRQKH